MTDESKELEDSLKKRYLFKVLASVFGLVSNLIIYSIVPRALGPASYGNFNFLSHFFSQLVEILDGRSSVGALVKTSQRPKEKGLVVSYLYYMLLVSSLLFVAIFVSHSFGIHDMIWPEQNLNHIYLAAIWGLFIWYHGILHKLCDAYGYTVLAEKVRMVQKLFAVVLLCLFYYFDYLTLQSFFIYYIGTLFMLVVGFWIVLMKHEKFPNGKDFRISFESLKEYFSEYATYTFPLLIYISIEAVSAIFDRWLLQYSSGSQEQGFFSLGFQISAISALFVSSIAPLIEREFSIAYGNKDFAQLRYLFKRYIPLLFSFAAFFSCFTFFHAENVIFVFAGEQYKNSLLVIIIMSAFPIFFTFGRILGSIFFATGQNILYRNLGLVFFLSGLLLSYVLVAPSEYGGWEMGAVGLAIKIVLVYGALVISQFYYGCKTLKISPWPFWLNQVLIVLLFMFFSFLSFEALYLFDGHGIFTKMIAGGLLYSAMILGVLVIFPRVFGLTNADITELIEKLWFVSNKKEALAQFELPEISEESGEPKKIMLLSARSSIHTVRWVNGLAEKGHEIILVSMHDGGRPLHPNVKYRQLPWGSPHGYFLNIPYFKKMLKEESPDLLHVHFVSGYGTMGSLSGYQPRVVSVWGTDIFNFPYLSQINKALIHYNLRTAQWICSTSLVMARQTAYVYKGAIQKMTVTPFGVDLDLFKKKDVPKDPSKVVIGTIKTLMDKYGIDTLIRGLAEARLTLMEMDPAWANKIELIICGEGPQEEYLKSLAQVLGIGGVTHFQGFVPHSEVPDFLNQMDIYVAMSREQSESFGVAIIEASACELPVVVSNFGGLPEVVSDLETGYVVKENTSEALCEKLVKLVLDKNLRDDMGRKGRQRVIDHYQWTDNLELMEQVYNHILGRKS